MRWHLVLGALAVGILSWMPAAAQVASVDVGRVYSIPDGGYVAATMPGIEVSKGPVTLSGMLVLNGSRLIERDLSIFTEHDRGRMTFRADANLYRYGGEFDWTVSAGIRIDLRRRHVTGQSDPPRERTPQTLPPFKAVRQNLPARRFVPTLPE